jgi:hypothetical protein
MTDLDADAHRHSVEKIFPRLGETATTDGVLRLLKEEARRYPRACSSFGCCLHEPARLACPGTDETFQVPCKERWLFQCIGGSCPGVWTARCRPAEGAQPRQRPLRRACARYQLGRARYQNLELFRYRGAWCWGARCRSWHDPPSPVQAEHMSAKACPMHEDPINAQASLERI